MRHFTFLDTLLTQVNDAFSTVFTVSPNARTNPAAAATESVFTRDEKKKSIGCMRVNHTGEVCAQALYRGQLLSSRSKKTRAMLEKSCEEETDHLAWTKERLNELHGKTSYLNCLWYFNSFLITDSTHNFSESQLGIAFTHVQNPLGKVASAVWIIRSNFTNGFSWKTT